MRLEIEKITRKTEVLLKYSFEMCTGPKAASLELRLLLTAITEPKK